MRTPTARALSTTALLFTAASLAIATRGQQDWAIHDMNRPQPRVVQPGTGGTDQQPGTAPSDAVVLFDGTGLSRWRTDKGDPAQWKVEGGYVEVVKGTGDIHTAQPFGDCQLHIEWRTPVPAEGEGQERGNSGVFLMGQYELQVLDSFDSQTYPDGQAGALYGQHPPLVNASRPPGAWQTYDVIFQGPRFAADGKLIQPAKATVFQNGVLVQNNSELTGPTAHKARPPYKQHPEKLPLKLQDHGNPVRYRNIWIREISAGA